jgi:hypothetical protein
MDTTWKTVRRGLLQLLGRPAARRTYKELRIAVPELKPWGAPRLVASFLSRRTSRLEQRKNVLRALLRTVAGRGARGELAGTILLLAGALSVQRLGRRGDDTPPALPFVLIVSAPVGGTDRERPLPQAIEFPSLGGLQLLPPRRALAGVSS